MSWVCRVTWLMCINIYACRNELHTYYVQQCMTITHENGLCPSDELAMDVGKTATVLGIVEAANCTGL